MKPKPVPKFTTPASVLTFAAAGRLLVAGAAVGELKTFDSAYFRALAATARDASHPDDVGAVCFSAGRALAAHDTVKPLECLSVARILSSHQWPTLEESAANDKRVRDPMRAGDRAWFAFVREMQRRVRRLAPMALTPSNRELHPSLARLSRDLWERAWEPLGDLSDDLVRGYARALALLLDRVAAEIEPRDATTKQMPPPRRGRPPSDDGSIRGTIAAEIQRAGEEGVAVEVLASRVASRHDSTNPKAAVRKEFSRLREQDNRYYSDHTPDGKRIYCFRATK